MEKVRLLLPGNRLFDDFCISAEVEDHPAFPDTALVRMYG